VMTVPHIDIHFLEKQLYVKVITKWFTIVETDTANHHFMQKLFSKGMNVILRHSHH
jgi:hypothetical protein